MPEREPFSAASDVCVCPPDGVSGRCPLHSALQQVIEATAKQLLKEHGETLRRLAEDD